MEKIFGILDDVVEELLQDDEEDELLEGELLFSPEYNMLIQFNPSPKKKGGHYFKVYNNRSSHKATLIARISFHYPVYDLHYKESGRIAKGKKEEKDKQSNWFLSADQKRNLIALLKESNPDYPSRSNWKQLIKKYNDERQNAYRGSDKEVIFLRNQLPMPNYLELPDDETENERKKNEYERKHPGTV